MRAIVDIEGDGLLDTLQNIWCLVARDVETKETYTFVRDEDFKEFDSLKKIVKKQSKLSDFKEFSKNITEFIGHNFINYDSRAIQRILNVNIPLPSITDTLVLSRMVYPTFEGGGGHSLEDWGQRLNCHKIHFDDWTKFSEDMLIYCVQDINVNEKVYEHLLKNSRGFSNKSIRIEHNMRRILDNMQDNGFKLDEARAQGLFVEISKICETIEAQIKIDYPPVKSYTEKYYLRLKKDGEPTAPSLNKIKKANGMFDIETDEEGKEYYHFYEMKEFNLASSADVRQRMEEAGWEPTIFKKPSKTQEAKGLTVGNPELCEENFATLPENAPQSAKNIARWMMLISRVRTIKQWFQALNPQTGCVHGSVISIGANTHRMSHNSPNMANISKVVGKKVEFKTIEAFEEYLDSIPEVEVMEADRKKLVIEHLAWGNEANYATDMRACWTVRDLKKRRIVGIDLSGIQLRAFAHYANNKEYMNQILSGDIHSYNRGILDEICKKYEKEYPGITIKYLTNNDKGRRNLAKTFIYAYLFGAGNAKIGNILGFPAEVQFKGGQFVKNGFVASIQGLDDFKKEIKDNVRKRGFMVALDGRLIKLPSEHFALSIYLQSFEAIVMKYALILATKKIKQEGLDALLVAVVHDETQWDVAKEHAERLGNLMVECMEQAGRDLGARMPLTGEYKVGKNWAESH
jgi:DNA polymerase-1